MKEKNKKIDDVKIYSKIIKYYENHTFNRLDAQFFILDCMNRLEKVKDEEIIDNSLRLLTQCLEDDMLIDSYNDQGLSTNELTDNHIKTLNCILKQEFTTSYGG